VLRISRRMLVPTVLSMLCAALLVVPFAVLPGVTGFEILHPMAVAVLGGLVTTAVIVLFVVPAGYLRYGDRAHPDTSTEDLYAAVPRHRKATEEPSAPPAAPVAQRVRRPHRVRRLLGVAPLAAACLLLSACAGAVEADSYVIEHEPAKVVHPKGEEQVQVVLENSAAERLRVETTEVGRLADRLVVPRSALFVGTDGTWWVFTNPEPLTYVRHEVVLDREHDGTAILASGPPAGTRVVTQGVAEIAGVEEGVGH
jgi:hypothetical protein